MTGQRRRGLVIGCGGTLGAAWIAAALVAVRDELDWDPREADLLMGTSAGAETVTMLGSGCSVDDILEMQLGTTTNPVLAEHLSSAPGAFPPVPRLGLPALGLLRHGRGLTQAAGLLPTGSGDAGWLDRLARGLNPGRDWVAHPATWLVATDCGTGARVAFGSPGAPRATLSQALRASWGVPGWFPPVEIGGRSYLDGGVVSTASVDLVAGAGLDEVIVLAPMASTGSAPARGLDVLERVLRRSLSAGLDHEIAALAATGVRIVRIDVTPADLAVMGPNFMDPSRRLATLEHSLRSTRRTVRQRLTEGALA